MEFRYRPKETGQPALHPLIRWLTNRSWKARDDMLISASKGELNAFCEERTDRERDYHRRTQSGV